MLDESIEEAFPASDPPVSHWIEEEVQPEQVAYNKKNAEPKK